MAALLPPPDPALPQEILQAAVLWYVQLNDEVVSDKQYRAWQTWLQADERHRQAWEKMQALKHSLARVPGAVALPTLGKTRQRRRHTVSTLLLLLSAGGAGVATYENAPWRAWNAAYRTQTGERRRVLLADGGNLDINTASALDIDYGPTLRQLRLYRGEIMIRTAHDAAARPFVVDTAQGRIRALGTRFLVRISDDRVLVGVDEGAVEITPTNASASPLRLRAGDQAWFSASDIQAPERLRAGLSAWVGGRLLADDMRLGDFIAELARYRQGHLSCDPAVADLRVSGVFRLHDTDHVLSNLTALLPLRTRYATRYWVRLEAR